MVDASFLLITCDISIPQEDPVLITPESSNFKVQKPYVAIIKVIVLSTYIYVLRIFVHIITCFSLVLLLMDTIINRFISES